MSSIREWLVKNKSKYKDRKSLVKACVKELKVNFKSVMNIVPSVWRMDGHPLPNINNFKKSDKKIKTKETHLMKKDDFLTGIDIVKQILNFLNETVQDSYIEDDKLRRRFEMGITKWKEISELPVFENRQFRYTKGSGQKGVVWSSKKGVEEAKSTISMARYEF